MKKTASIFDIKSARIDALVLELKNASTELLNNELRKRFARVADTSSVPLLIDLSLFHSESDLDLTKILALFNHYGLNIFGIRHTDKSFEKIANKHKLSFHLSLPAKSETAIEKNNKKQDDNIEKNQTETISNTEKAEVKSDLNKDTGTNVVSSKEEVKKDEKNINPLPKKLESKQTMVISRPVRSGQQVYAKNADLIVLDLVSPGAEVLADGNIHVYAPLRGRALAGVSGNKQARIFAQCMQAELVSIAGIYRSIDQDLPKDITSKPAQIYVDQNKLVIKSLK